MEPVHRAFKRKKTEKTGEEEASTKIMYAYKVINLQNRDSQIQTRKYQAWSDNVDNHLSKEFTTLEVKRTGSSTDTSQLMAV